ncbi:hypothetical protein AKJ16_DCAP23000 [Drosera capensis]
MKLSTLFATNGLASPGQVPINCNRLSTSKWITIARRLTTSPQAFMLLAYDAIFRFIWDTFYVQWLDLYDLEGLQLSFTMMPEDQGKGHYTECNIGTTTAMVAN